jgi:nitroimidazol reductase NimA-like FMN-containing flavoprotein (pyridoxamine 5'-phosphate oxidase superfamily)
MDMTEEKTAEKSKQEIMEAFLAKPHLARVGTANPKTAQPHVTPVWYGWDGDCVYFSGFRSTRKFKELVKNPKCAVLIDTAETGLGMTGVLFEGTAEIITEPRDWVKARSEWIYLRYLGPEGIKAADPQSWIADPDNTVVRLKPEHTYTW